MGYQVPENARGTLCPGHNVVPGAHAIISFVVEIGPGWTRTACTGRIVFFVQIRLEARGSIEKKVSTSTFRRVRSLQVQYEPIRSFAQPLCAVDAAADAAASAAAAAAAGAAADAAASAAAGAAADAAADGNIFASCASTAAADVPPTNRQPTDTAANATDAPDDAFDATVFRCPLQDRASFVRQIVVRVTNH